MTTNTPRRTPMAWPLALIATVASGVACPIRADEPGSTAKRPASAAMPADQSYYLRYWPQGHPALFKLKTDLVLAVPPEFQKFWLQRDQVVRVPTPLNQLPVV